ncbi:MAG: arginase family protein [Nitrososphaeraceae archaeon]
MRWLVLLLSIYILTGFIGQVVLNGDRFPLANVTSMSEAEIALVLVADESKSLATRKGTDQGPRAMRCAFENSEVFKREGKTILICPMRNNYLNRRILDTGFTSRNDLHSLICELVTNKIVPVIIGGDHSITTVAIDAISATLGKIGLVYFDAHPDFVSSKRDYYGSVITDSLGRLDGSNVTFIGTRAAELEEVENIQRSGFQVVSPLDIVENGINRTIDKICTRNTSRKYVSIDLDCLDPAYAPGVSVPTPCGLTSVELTCLVKHAVSSGIVGMDIVELCPKYDMNDITASLAARLLSESVASIRSAYLS